MGYIMSLINQVTSIASDSLSVVSGLVSAAAKATNSINHVASTVERVTLAVDIETTKRISDYQQSLLDA
jgi:hypothetical protein